MTAYFFKRLLWAVPTLLAISLLSFALNRLAPGDAVDIQSGHYFSQNTSSADPAALEREYATAAHDLHLDEPAFYFTLTTAIFPDSFFKILHHEQRKSATALLEKTGDWPSVQNWKETLRSAQLEVETMTDSSFAERKTELRKTIQNLLVSSDFEEIEGSLTQMEAILRSKPVVFISKIKAAFQNMKSHAEQKTAARWIPKFIWHGSENQYHRWLTHFLGGDFGKSWADNRPVSQKIGEALRLTLALNLAAILLSYLIAVPLGVFSARRAGSKIERGLHFSLLAIYSMPVFWMATLAVVFLTSSQFGFKIFPSIGLGDLPSDSPFWPLFFEKMSHLLLPVLILTLHALAFITRQMRSAVLSQLPELYIRTARAKGLPEKTVVWRHAFPNALFPLITLFAGLLPATIAGSLVIEVIFQIPGMGQLTYLAFFGHDWPVVFAILMLTAVMTVVGSLLADLLYAWADPRVRFD